eukprot:3560863-Pyramimonas_sp.AAC.1
MEGFEKDGTAIVDRAAGDAHEQNAEAEVHGQWFERILKKVIAEQTIDNQADWLEAVAACCEAKNRLTRRSGYSPLQW